LFGTPTGLVRRGRMAALIFAYLVLYLAVALQVWGRLERVTPSIPAAARLLARGSTLKHVHRHSLRRAS
jgi:iron(III) transport system permease protein